MMFRNYSNKEENKINVISETYKNQREKINYTFNNYLVNKYCIFNQKDNFWTLFHKLDNIVDLSDPDTNFPNSIHALQTAEAIRKDNLDDWLVLCGLLHDFGKIIYLKGNDNDGIEEEVDESKPEENEKEEVEEENEKVVEDEVEQPVRKKRKNKTR